VVRATVNFDLFKNEIILLQLYYEIISFEKHSQKEKAMNVSKSVSYSI